jgi:hypothetical protein
MDFQGTWRHYNKVVLRRLRWVDLLKKNFLTNLGTHTGKTRRNLISDTGTYYPLKIQYKLSNSPSMTLTLLVPAAALV